MSGNTRYGMNNPVLPHDPRRTIVKKFNYER